MRTGILKLGQHRIERFRPRMAGTDLAASDRCGDKKGAGFNAIRQHRVICATEPLDAFDNDRSRARTRDLCAHADQAIGQIDDFGLLRGVFDDRGALGKYGSHHQVFGSGHGDQIKHDARALEALGARLDVAVLDTNLGTQRLQALDMQIDRARTDRAAAWQGNLSLAVTGD